MPIDQPASSLSDSVTGILHNGRQVEANRRACRGALRADVAHKLRRRIVVDVQLLIHEQG